MATATAVTEVVQRTNAPVRRHGLVLAVIVACRLMLMLDTTVMTAVLPRIQARLRFSPVGLSWVMSACAPSRCTPAWAAAASCSVWCSAG